MSVPRLARALLAAALVVVTAGACAQTASAQAMNVYSSLPMQGTSREQSLAIVRGARLALNEAGGQAGGIPLNFISLDDSTRANPGTADEDKTRANAQRVAADPYALAYIGEFNSGGTKVSLPVLNRAGILQVSPSNTYNGLTVGGPGTEPAEPEAYYPTGRRTYGRIVPNDAVQGAALATLMRQSGCRSAFLTHDGSVYSAGIADTARTAARRLGLRISGSSVALPTRRGLRRLVARLNSRCVLYAGIVLNGAVDAVRAMAARSPRARFFASDGVAEEAFTNPREGGIPRRIGRRTLMTVANVGYRDLPPSARAFAARYRAAYGTRHADVYAVHGYEAMAVVLDSIRRAAPRSADRSAVVDAFFATRDRDSVLGTYGIDANGDTTLRDYGVYRISRGYPTYARRVRAR